MASRPQHTTFRQSPYPAPGAPASAPSLKSQASTSSSHSPSIQRKSSASRSPKMQDCSATDRPASDSPHFTDTPSATSPTDTKDASNDPARSTWPPAYPSHSQAWAGQATPTSISPLTTTLPPETQMFFGAAFGNLDSYGNPTTAPDKSQPLFSYDCQPSNPPNFHQPYLDGMNQTLAPEAMTSSEHLNWPQSGSNHKGNAVPTHQSSGLDFNDANGPFDFFSKGFDETRFNGQLTPGDNDWSAFIDTNSWDDNET